MTIVLNIFVVFALTLILTKSKVLAGKREFVEERYAAAKVGDQQPGWFHRWWHALWYCPMCSGFWIAIPVCFFYPAYGLFIDVLVVFGVNWLVHCLENLLFFSGKLAEDVDNVDFKEISQSKFARLIERNLRKFLDRRDK